MGLNVVCQSTLTVNDKVYYLIVFENGTVEAQVRDLEDQTRINYWTTLTYPSQ